VEKYNKLYLALWLLFSAAVFTLMAVSLLDSLSQALQVDESVENEGLGLSFLLLFFASEIVGFVLATLTIHRISWAHYVHVFFPF